MRAPPAPCPAQDARRPVNRIPVITVDGPGATGKGTVCAYLAEWLGWHLLDSGALYRALALAAREKRIAADDEAALARLAAALNVQFRAAGAGRPVEVWLNGRAVDRALRAEATGQAASALAARAMVRAALLARQRGFRRAPGLVADGRDMGTVVFPAAELKLFLTASPGQRAKRRHKQLKQQGISANLPDLYSALAERDERDRQRPVAPARPAQDAIVIDTGLLTIKGVLAKIRRLARAKMPDLP